MQNHIFFSKRVIAGEEKREEYRRIGSNTSDSRSNEWNQI